MGIIGMNGNGGLSGGSLDADYIPYDNSSSGLSSDTVGDAIDELALGGGGGTAYTTVDIDNSNNNYTPPLTVGVIRCDTSLGDVIIDLPQVSSFSRTEELVIFHINGSNNVLINCFVGDTYGGTYTIITMDNVDDSVVLRPFNNTKWLAVGQTISYS